MNKKYKYTYLHIKISKTIILYLKAYNLSKFICRYRNLQKYCLAIHRL